MTPDEILKGLYDETMVGNKPAVLELTQEGIDSGLPPERMLFEALIPSLEEVGARFERGDWFVPEMLIAGKAMAARMATIATTIINSISVNPDCLFMSNILLSMVPEKCWWKSIHTPASYPSASGWQQRQHPC